jgi:hypothetical protein
MKKSLLYVVAVVSLTVLFSVGAVAQKSVEGEWDAVFNTPGGPRPFKLVLKVDGERLTGTAKRPSGDVPVAGTIKGIDISFNYSISYNGNTVTLNYTGKVSGDSMSGTVMFNENASDEWSAKRTSAKQ